MPDKALLIYYTFTDQARIAAETAASCLRAQNYEVAQLRIDFADPEQRLRRPLPFSEQTRLGNLAQRRVVVPVSVDQPGLLDARYQLVVIISNTWKFHPSVPIQSFLATPAARAVLDGTAFAVVVVCRGFWRRNLRIVRESAERLGGRYLAGEGFGFAGGWLTSTIQSIRYVISDGPAERRWTLFRLPPFGLSPSSLQRLQTFIKRLPMAVQRGALS